MKSFRVALCLVFAALLVIALVPACKKAPTIPTPSAIEGTLSAVKDEFAQEVGKTIDDYQLKADELAKKAEAMPSPAKEEAIKKIDALKAKLAEAKTKLEEVKTATDATWDKTKTDVDTVLKDLATAYSDAASVVK